MRMHDIQIFIVDDDASVRDSLSLLLGLKGYSSASFQSAEHFLASLRPEWRGCVVTDVEMPGMSGLELHAALARMGSALPVIVMSASCDPAVEARALAGGAAGFVAKPFDADQLLAVVTRALNRAEP
jgi:two-component system, LuxR family, response regulator FixJ